MWGIPSNICWVTTAEATKPAIASRRASISARWVLICCLKDGCERFKVTLDVSWLQSSGNFNSRHGSIIDGIGNGKESGPVRADRKGGRLTFHQRRFRLILPLQG